MFCTTCILVFVRLVRIRTVLKKMQNSQRGFVLCIALILSVVWFTFCKTKGLVVCFEKQLRKKASPL